jgi:hypothetical protein
MHKFFHFYLIFLYFFFFDFRITFLLAQTPSSQPSSQPSTQPVVRFSSSLKEGLVAYYPFDSNCEDKSGNNNHGTIHGSVLLTADRFNQAASAYDFNGVTGYIEIPGQQFNFPNQMSISLWVKQLPNPPSNGWNVLVDKSHYSTISNQNVGGWTLQQQSVDVGNLDFYYVVNSAGEYDHPYGTTHVTISTTGWTHIVITKSNNVLQFYKNGELEETVTGSISRIISTGNKPFLLGAANLGNTNPASGVSNYWAGSMDDVAIYNRTLDIGDVYALFTAEYPTSQPSRQPSAQPIPNPTSQPTTEPTYKISAASLRTGLVAYYRFDGDAKDGSGNGNHGLIRGIVYSENDRYGNPNTAFVFNGGYIEIPGQNFNFFNNMSVSLWLKPATTHDSYAIILSKSYYGDSEPRNWVLQRWESSREYYFNYPHSGLVVDSNSLAAPHVHVKANSWAHIVLVKTNNLLTFYLNGVLNSSTIASNWHVGANGNLPLMIGATNQGYTFPATTPDAFYKGSMDDIMIYNRSLTAGEVGVIYNSDSPASQPSNQPSRIPSAQPSSLPTIPLSSTLKEGLVAYYSFTGNAKDSSGNRNDGTLRGGMSFSTDRLGFTDGAAYFDGVNDFIEIPGPPFNFHNNMSIAFWIKPAPAPNDFHFLFDHRSSLPGGAHKGGWFILQYANAAFNYMYNYCDRPGDVPSSGKTHLVADKWSHVAFVKENTLLSVYVNGSLISSASSSTNSSILPTGDNPLLIGASKTGDSNPAANVGNFYHGALDEIFIYDRALTQSEILQLNSFDAPTSQPSSQPSFQPSRQPSGQPTSLPTIRISSTLKNGLVAYYSFNGNANDRSSNGNNGVIHGAKNNFVTDRFGNAASACSFNGSTYIEIPGNQFNFNNNMSVAFWINPSASPDAWNVLFDKHFTSGSQHQKGWFIQQNTEPGRYAYVFIHSPGGIGATSSTNLIADTWNHVVFTKGDSRLSVYVNGQKTWSDLAASKVIIQTDLQPLVIGAVNIGQSNPASNLNYFFKGVLDEIFIYNRTLSSTEVTRLYAFETPTSQPSRQPSSQPSSLPTIRISSTLKDGLVAYYSFSGNALDLSGNGNNGVLRGGMGFTNDRLGTSNSAVYFDGTNDFIEIPGKQFNFQNNMSVAFWIKPGYSPANWTYLLDHRSTSTVHKAGWAVLQFGSAAYNYEYVYIDRPDHGPFSGQTHLVALQWAHVAFVKANTLLSVYVNGSLIWSGSPSTNSSIIPTGNNLLVIGACNLGETNPASNMVNLFRGALDEIFIYGRALTRSEILQLNSFDTPTSQPSSQPSLQPSRHPSGQPSKQPSKQPISQPSGQPTSMPTIRISSTLKNGLVAYYSFNGNANDRSSNGNNGVIHGAKNNFVTDRFGNAASACSFNGSTYIEIPGRQFNFNNNMSVAFWINPSASPDAWNALFDKHFSSVTQYEKGWFIQQNGVDASRYFYAFVHSPGQYGVTSSINLNANTWNHVAFTKGDSRLTVYVNGQKTWSDVVASKVIIQTDLQPLIIGAANIGQSNPASNLNYFYKGILDEVFIYNRTLSSSEVTRLYAFETPTSQPSGQPTRQPSSQPSRQPISRPTSQPSQQPTSQPSIGLSSSLGDGLFAVYRFRGNAKDESGNRNHGTVRSGATLTDDRFGNANNAYSFNHGYIEIPGQPFNFANNMTLSLWVKPGVTQEAYAVLLSKSHYWTGQRNWVLQQDNTATNTYFFNFPQTGGIAKLTILANVWSHLVITKRNKVVSIYLNGAFVTSATASTSKLESNYNLPLMIGASNSAYTIPAGNIVQYYSGVIDDVLIYNRTLTVNEVRQLYYSDTPTSQPSGQPSRLPSTQPTSHLTGPSPQPTSQPSIPLSTSLQTGLVAFYRFRGNANDESGNRHHGIVRSGATLVTDRFGNANNAYSFNHGYIEIPGQSFNFVNNLTLSLWVKPQSTQDGYAVLLSKSHYSGSSQHNWVLQQDDNNANAYMFNYPQSINSVKVTISANVWSHLVVVKRNKLMSIYLNGAFAASATASTSKLESNGNLPLVIGASNNAYTMTASGMVNYYSGAIDDLIIYNRSLTAYEIRELYDYDTPTSQPSSLPSTQPSQLPSSQPSSQPTNRISSSLKNGLVAYYSCNGHARDGSGNGNNGMIRGGMTFNSARTGLGGSACFFGGANYLEIPGEQFNFRNNMSVAFWVKTSAAVPLSGFHICDRRYNVTSQQQAAGWSIEQSVSAASYSLNYVSEPWTVLASDILTFTANQWYHAVFTKSDNKLTRYLNGGISLVSSKLVSSAVILPAPTHLPLLIGAQNSGQTNPAIPGTGTFFKGTLDEIFVYNRTLTASEVLELYSFDTPTSQPSSQPTDLPIATPSVQPTSPPTGQPIRRPSSQPSVQPSRIPSAQPSNQPTIHITSSMKNGLVAYYSFDGTAKDKSGNGNNGILREAVEFGADRFGQPGSACHFVNNGYIEVPGKQFNFHNNMSVVFWLNPTNSQDFWNYLFDKRYDEPGRRLAGWYIQQDNNNARNYAFTYVYGPGALIATDPIQFPADTWSHVAYVKSGKYIEIYFNGVLLWSRKGTVTEWILPTPSDLPLLIGAVNGEQTNPATGVNSYYKGFIDEIFIYNRSLTVSEVKQLYSFDVPTSQPSSQPSSQPVSLPTSLPTMEPTNRISSSLKKCLVAYYPFQGNANDESGHGFHGTIYGNNLQLVPDRFGNANNAYLFNDNASYIGIEGTPFGFTNNFSISLWVYASAYQQHHSTIISKSHFVNAGWAVLWAPDDSKFEFVYMPNSGSWASNLQFATILPYVWTHVVVVKENHFSTVYLNGNEVAQVYNFEESVLANSMPLLIGTASAGSKDLFFTGRLDDIAFFDCALKKSDVAELYQLDTPTSQPSNSPTSQPTVRIPSFLREGLVAYYPFNGNAKDATEYNTDGVIHGGVKLVDDRFGNRKAAFSFNGRDSYIEFPGTAFNFDRNLSISFWVKPSAQQAPWASIMDKSLYTNGFTGQFGVQQDITNTNKYLACFGYDLNVGNCGPALQIPGDVWSHFMITKMNKVVKLYVNSNLQLTFSLPGPGLMRNGNKPLIIGAANAVSVPFPTSSVIEYWNGTMDDVFFFNRVLHLEEIMILSNFDSPTSQPSGSPTTQPQSSPSSLPSNVPSTQPSGIPTDFPSTLPSSIPSPQPSSLPSVIPTIPPTSEPSSAPSASLVASLKTGLVAYYPLDGNADDKSGNRNHGVSFFTELTSDRYGKGNSAYYFNGVNSHVIINHGNSFRFLQNFTVSLWINPGLNQLTSYIFLSKYAIYFVQNPSGYGFGFYDSESQFCNPGGQLQFDLGIWYHVVITKEEKFAKLFVNNKMIGSANATVAPIQSNGNEPVSLGSFTSPLGGFFNGSIDDIFVYDRALSTHEIFLLYNRESPTGQPSGYPSSQPTDHPTVTLDSSLKNGLVAYYPFHQNAHDNSGNEHHGVVHSAVPFADRYGRPKTAYYFDGVSSYIELPGAAFSLVDLSLLFWMNPEPNQIAFTTIFDKSCRNFETGNVNGWIFLQSEALNKYAFNYFNPQGIPADATNSLPITLQARHWNHVGIVKSGNKVSYYINGELAAENANYTFPAISSNGDLPLIVGGLNYGHTAPASFVVNYFHGSIDEVFVYNRPVSGSEVKAIMEFEMPTSQPTSQPSQQPSSCPTARPTVFIPPTSQPSSRPSKSPSNQPSGRPTSQPRSFPTTRPSCSPSRFPSIQPSRQPTSRPSTQPTKQPAALPTASPSTQPFAQPSARPTNQPTSQPSRKPTSVPSCCPTGQPSSQPSRQPFSTPSSLPSTQHSRWPSFHPTGRPSAHPTMIPSGQPTTQPWSVPSTRPSRQPSAHSPSPSSTSSPPSSQPTGTPTSSSQLYTGQQTGIPSVTPSLTPSELVVPSSFPSSRPTDGSSGPTVMHSPDTLPPSPLPSSSFVPTSVPFNLDSSPSPSLPPTHPSSPLPSVIPTRLPSIGPSIEISSSPSGQPTRFPSSHPSISSSPQIVSPSGKPSGQPSSVPSIQPISFPTPRPTDQPTSRPSSQPVATPTRKPSTNPSRLPTSQPSSQPSRQPLPIPSSVPSAQPSRQPSCRPTKQPFSRPSSVPSSQPTVIPSSSRPSSFPTIQTEKPSFPLPPSISAYPTTTRKPTGSPFTKKPTAIPSLRPSFSPTLAPTAALSIFPLSTRFQSQLFFLGSFLPNSEAMTSTIQLADGSSSSLGTSYLIFGKRNNSNDELVIGSRDSLGLYTELSSKGTEGGYLTRDTVSRSFMNIGDVNKDDLDDLLLCSPASSLCYLYLGKRSNGVFENLQVSSSISLFSSGEDGESYSLLGWAASSAGDMNSDGVNDFAISALIVNTVYVLYGQSPSLPSHIILSQLTPSQGFKITAAVADVSSLSNLGIPLTKVGDFNGDEISDLAITGMNVQTSQNIIFLVFGRNSTLINDLSLSLSGRNPHYHRIITPSRSFSGFSIAGLGDINGDGLADLAIGSLPYLGGYSTQKTYVLYGRKNGFDQDFSLSNLNSGVSDGFVINGGGFMVGSPGDVNADGLNDLMITSYTSWQGQGNAYVMIFPKDMSSSPTFAPTVKPSEQPTSTPSVTPTITKTFFSENPTNLPSIETLQPTNRVGLQTNSPNMDVTRLPTRPPQPLKTNKPSRLPSFRPTSGRPTKKPSFIPTIKPSIRPTFIPSLLPSKTSSPTREPSLKPAKQRNVPVLFPSSSPSVFPTPPSSMISPVVVIDQAGVYDLPDGHGLVSVTANGNVLISGHNGRKIYKIIPSNGNERTSITITDFDNHQDTLDLTEFHATITTINELTYTTNPLVFHLSIEQIVVLSSHSEFDLTSKNFVFREENPSSDSSSSSDGKFAGFSFSGSFIASIVVLVGCVCFVSVTVGLPTLEKKTDLLNGKKNKIEKNKEEEIHRYNEEEEENEDDDDVVVDEHPGVDLEAGNKNNNNNNNNDNGYDMNMRISIMRNTIPMKVESDENNNEWNNYYSRQEEAEDNNDEEKVTNSSDDLEMSSYSDEEEEGPLGGNVEEGSDSWSGDYELTISEESQDIPVLSVDTLPVPAITNTFRANSILLNPSADQQQEEEEGEEEENEISDNSSSDLTLSDEEEEDDEDEKEQDEK